MWVKKRHRSPTGTGADSPLSRVGCVAAVSRHPTQRQLLGSGGDGFRDPLSLPSHPSIAVKSCGDFDQGFGGDHNINWLLDRRYGVLAKGCSNRRAALLAQQVKRWRAVRNDKWSAAVCARPQAESTHSNVCDPLHGAHRLEAHLFVQHAQAGGRCHGATLRSSADGRNRVPLG